MQFRRESFQLSEREKALLPSEEEVAFYRDHGWYLSRRLFSDEELDRLADASDAFYAGRRDRALPMRPRNIAYWEPEHGEVQRHNDYIHYESREIGSIVSKPLLGAVAALLSGSEETRIFQCTLIYKPAQADEPTNLVPWHFDRHYWATCVSDRMLTAFVPLHDCTEDMGTITMVDGSHRWTEVGERDSTTLHFAKRRADELEEMLELNALENGAVLRKIPISIPRGHVSFHHCRTYHGSGANRSDRPRRAISVHLQDGENRYRRVQLSDGTSVSYNHDELVRRSDAGEPDYADPEFCPLIWQK